MRCTTNTYRLIGNLRRDREITVFIAKSIWNNHINGKKNILIAPNFRIIDGATRVSAAKILGIEVELVRNG